MTTPAQEAAPLFATIGFFDGVHIGHRTVIDKVKNEAAKRGFLSAVFSFDTHPQTVLHPEAPFFMLTSPEERSLLLRQTGVDRVTLLEFTAEFSRLSARDFLQILSTRHNVRGLLVGYDHRFGHNRAEGFEQYVRYGEELGIEVLKADAFTDGEMNVSSSAIRQLLERGEVATANRLLSYPYTLTGTVTEGHRIGRTLGFPTANIAVDYTLKLIPAHGVYAVQTHLSDGSCHRGILNIGNRPTLSRTGDCSIEVHILDFSGDLYGQRISVEFIEYLRPEKAFGDTEALRLQIERDREEARRIL